MRYSVAFFAVFFAACGWASSATAQVVLNRDSATYYFQRGNELHKYEVYADKQAIAHYTKSIAFDGSQYWAYRNRGDCYQNLKDYPSALADYSRAVATEGAAPASSVRFDCLAMCSRLALWSEAAAHCSALLANPLICADTTEIFWHPTACVDTNRIAWRILWLQRAEARVKLRQYASARQDYLAYQRQILKALAIEEKWLAEAQAPPALYWRRAVAPSKKKLSAMPAPPVTLTPREPLPKRLRAEVLARHQKSLAWQRARVNKLRAESEAVAAKVTELDKLPH